MSYEYVLKPEDFSDWAGLYQLLDDSFEYMSDRIDPPSSFAAMNAKSLEEKTADETLLIVKTQKDLVGCAFFRLQQNEVYIGKIAVHSKHRRSGITRRIIEIAMVFGRQNSKPMLELQTRIELVENQQTFTHLGFEKTGETSHQGYERPTSITMRKKID